MTFKESVQDDKWIEAMKEEILALQDNNTWEIVTLLVNKQPIGCKWVYIAKYHVDGTIKRYKAHLVVKGYTQKRVSISHKHSLQW